MELEQSERCVPTIDTIKKRFTDRRCTDVQQLLSTMANPIRFRMLCALKDRAFAVSELVEIAESHLSNVSQHLKMMWMAGYVSKMRRGRQVVYALADPKVAQVIALFERLFPPEEAEAQGIDGEDEWPNFRL